MMNQSEIPKCIWSGKRDNRVKAITLKTLDRFSFPTEKEFHVLPEYEQNLREYNKKLCAHGRTFLLFILTLSAILMTAPVFVLLLEVPESLILYAVGVLIASLGIGIIFYPFATPETVKWLGLERAIKIARYTGVIMILLGILIGMLPHV